VYLQGAYPVDSAGLVSFCYASQNHIVAVVILILTAFCTFGLGAVALWFMAERWAYTRHQGRRWLADVVEDHWKWLYRGAGLGHFTRAVIAVWRMLLVGLRSIRSALCTCYFRGSGGATDSESLPTTTPKREMESRPSSPVHFLRRKYTFGEVAQEKMQANRVAVATPAEKTTRMSEDTMNNGSVSVRPAHTGVESAPSESPSSPLDSPASSAPDTPTPEGAFISSAPILGAAGRFRSIAWRIAKANRQPASATDALLDLKAKEPTPIVSGRDSVTAKSKIHALRPQLKKLEVMHTIDAHGALVR
jgi:hypothetical protein